jgi:hypothetical protein
LLDFPLDLASSFRAATEVAAKAPKLTPYHKPEMINNLTYMSV